MTEKNRKRLGLLNADGFIRKKVESLTESIHGLKTAVQKEVPSSTYSPDEHEQQKIKYFEETGIKSFRSYVLGEVAYGIATVEHIRKSANDGVKTLDELMSKKALPPEVRRETEAEMNELKVIGEYSVYLLDQFDSLKKSIGNYTGQDFVKNKAEIDRQIDSLYQPTDSIGNYVGLKRKIEVNPVAILGGIVSFLVFFSFLGEMTPMFALNLMLSIPVTLTGSFIFLKTHHALSGRNKKRF